jgi:hypothetical protein
MGWFWSGASVSEGLGKRGAMMEIESRIQLNQDCRQQISKNECLSLMATRCSIEVQTKLSLLHSVYAGRRKTV